MTVKIVWSEETMNIGWDTSSKTIGEKKTIQYKTEKYIRCY